MGEPSLWVSHMLLNKFWDNHTISDSLSLSVGGAMSDTKKHEFVKLHLLSAGRGPHFARRSAVKL